MKYIKNAWEGIGDGKSFAEVVDEQSILVSSEYEKCIMHYAFLVWTIAHQIHLTVHRCEVRLFNHSVSATSLG